MFALRSSRFNRKEDMKHTGKREPMKVIYKIGYNDDGSLISLQMDFHMDGTMHVFGILTLPILLFLCLLVQESNILM